MAFDLSIFTTFSRPFANFWRRYPKGIDNPFFTWGCEYLLFLCKSCLRSVAWCNTPDVIYLICTPTLAVSGTKLFCFLVVGILSPCVVVFVMHLISCHHVHCIRIRVCLMQPSIFPVVRFAFRRSYVTRCPFLPLFMCGG